MSVAGAVTPPPCVELLPEPDPLAAALPPECPLCTVPEPPLPDSCSSTTAERGAPALLLPPALLGTTSLRIKSAPPVSISTSGISATEGMPASPRKMRKGSTPRLGLRSLATIPASEPDGWERAASGVKAV